MRSFLETWLSEAPKVFQREMSTEVQLKPSDQLPALASAFCLGITITGARTGRFLIVVDREGLHALLVQAKVQEAAAEFSVDSELWKGLIQQLAGAVAASEKDIKISAPEEIAWPLGLPVAAWQLKLGPATARLAWIDEVRPSVESASAPAAPPKAQTTYSQRSIDLLLDVELEASLRFGSREMRLNDVLDLGPGDVVQLDRHVSDPVDLLVGDKIVAKGEVVLVNGSFGFRVGEVAEPKQCLESIRCLF
jgi:flagellar motor switch protein FliN